MYKKIRRKNSQKVGIHLLSGLLLPKVVQTAILVKKMKRVLMMSFPVDERGGIFSFQETTQ